MSNTQNRPGYVPVTIELPAELAEEFQRKNYYWSSVVELLLQEFKPGDVAETLLTLYFELTRLIVVQREEFIDNDSVLTERLFMLEKLYRALHTMSVPIVNSPNAPFDAIGQLS